MRDYVEMGAVRSSQRRSRRILRASVCLHMPRWRSSTYDPSWPAAFDTEHRAPRAAAACQAPTVHHIGSTAVPGLAAKPIIDMVALVE